MPTLTLKIIGQNPPAEVQALRGNGIDVLGWVPETFVHLASARVSIAPLLVGAGMKGKVGEALAAGVPVVGTSIACEGIGIVDAQDAMVANDPEVFAARVLDVYSDPEIWERLSRNGQRLIEQRYSPTAIRSAIRSMVAPTINAPLHWCVAPNWNDEAELRALVAAYIAVASGHTNTTLELMVPSDVGFDDVGERLVAMIEADGFDTEAIPDLALTPMGTDSLTPPGAIVLSAVAPAAV